MIRLGKALEGLTREPVRQLESSLWRQVESSLDEPLERSLIESLHNSLYDSRLHLLRE